MMSLVRRSGFVGIWLCAALLLAACGGAAAAPLGTPTPVYIPPVPTTPPTPTPRPARDAAEIVAAWPASTNMDGVHRKAGLKCEDCHLQLPAKSAPLQDTCLKCHGGNWDALVAKTAESKPTNPHVSHLGAIGCENCHNAHGPFVYYCSSCHNTMTYNGRLR